MNELFGSILTMLSFVEYELAHISVQYLYVVVLNNSKSFLRYMREGNV